MEKPLRSNKNFILFLNKIKKLKSFFIGSSMALLHTQWEGQCEYNTEKGHDQGPQILGSVSILPHFIKILSKKKK